MSEVPSVSPSLFYGKKCELLQKRSGENSTKKEHTVIPYTPRNLLSGPNISWKVYRKQDLALEFMKTCKDGLMCFAFEHFGPGRLFLVAHPEVFWHYDHQRDSDSRCSYEIITEYTACKLYVDLEYDISLNKCNDGFKMVNIFIKLLCFYIKQHWNIVCNRKDIINLDSTTSSKFSRHLIFDMPTFCFADNYNVGYFVKYVCQNVRDIIERDVLPDTMCNEFSIDDLKSLFAVDAKGNFKMFCDEGVYTKNRHFRLFGSTKKGKKSNLVLSEDNEFKSSSELELFLHTLITYISSSDIKVLEFNNFVIEKSGFSRQSLTRLESKKEAAPSPYPLIDKFISDLVSPGKIYRSIYFSTKKLILYDIVGNRFCGNIGRPHKSNNVKYIIDLNECIYYQKCYDYDCSNYRSEKLSLPYEIIFKLSDNTDICGGCDNNHGLFDLSPSETEQVLEVLKAVENFSPSTNKKFPSFGLNDEEFLKIKY